MTVVDASVLVDMLLGGGSEAGDSLADRFRRNEPVCAPHLVDAEVCQVLRRYVLRRRLSLADAGAMVDDLVALPISRYPHPPLLARAFELLENVTIYDALYLALAEALECPLVTGDSALAAVPSSRARVEVVSTSET